MRLDNYIMEQDINTASVADIFVEQAQAELNVAMAIASSYTKEAMIMEYVMEGSITDTAVNKGVDESKLKKILLFIPRFFKAIFTRFMAMFKKKDIATAKVMLDNIPDAVKSEVLVPMTVAELEKCMTAIDNIAGVINGRGSNNGIIGKLDAFCEKLYKGDYKYSNELKFDQNTLKSIEIVENFNLSKIIAKHRAEYNKLARQMAGTEVKTSFKTKEEANKAPTKAEGLLAPEGTWLGKMPTKKVNINQNTSGENFADASKFEEMIKKLETLRNDLSQFRKDADEAVKSLENAVKADEAKKENKQNPELRNAISDAIALCNRVNKAVVHFCNEIEQVIGVEMSIVNQVANVKDFSGVKNTLGAFYKGKSYEGSFITDKNGTANTDLERRRSSATMNAVKNEKGGSWGLDDAVK